MTAILIRAIDFAQIRSVAEALVARQVGIDLHAPQQVGPRSGRLLPERVAEEASIGQAQHARANMGDHVLGQYYLSLVVRTLGGAKKELGAALDERDEAQLWKGALAPCGTSSSEHFAFTRLVGHVEPSRLTRCHCR